MTKITDKFTKIDGTEETRSLMDDFQTLSYRFILRIKNHIGEENSDVLEKLKTALTNYDWGRYEDALAGLKEALKEKASLKEELDPFVEICERVVSTEKNEQDLRYEEFLEEVKAWKGKSFLYRFFNQKKKPYFHDKNLFGSVTKIRCKYCGHYTSYIPPNQGMAYFKTNNCDHCKRGYPVPTFEWDNIDGQAYIFYRGSVSEKEFYDEFEQKHDVKPGRDRFMVKS